MIRAAIFTMIFAIQAASATVPGYYTESATVREINGDLITIETDQQQLFDFFGDGYNPGDEITVLFSDNNTDQITDDIIVNVLEDYSK